jgi:hypothetical protein
MTPRRGWLSTFVAVGAGPVSLFAARLLSEFTPAALAIGTCMFVAGALGGAVVGYVQGIKHRHS